MSCLIGIPMCRVESGETESISTKGPRQKPNLPHTQLPRIKKDTQPNSARPRCPPPTDPQPRRRSDADPHTRASGSASCLRHLRSVTPLLAVTSTLSPPPSPLGHLRSVTSTLSPPLCDLHAVTSTLWVVTLVTSRLTPLLRAHCVRVFLLRNRQTRRVARRGAQRAACQILGRASQSAPLTP